jgi:hypothetical protein
VEEMKVTYIILSENSRGKDHFGKHRRREEDIIKYMLKEYCVKIRSEFN